MEMVKTELKPRTEILNYIRILLAQNINGYNPNEIVPSPETIRNNHGRNLELEQKHTYARHLFGVEQNRGGRLKCDYDGVTLGLVDEMMSLIDHRDKPYLSDEDYEAFDKLEEMMYKFRKYLTEFLGLKE